MAHARIQVQVVDRLEVGDLAQGLRTEGRLPLKGVEHDSLEQVAECYVLELRKRLQHLQDSALHPDTGLDAFDFEVLHRLRHRARSTGVFWYQGTMSSVRQQFNSKNPIREVCSDLRTTIRRQEVPSATPGFCP